MADILASTETFQTPPHHRWMTAIAALMLGGVVAMGLSGLAGGRDRRDFRTTAEATLLIEGPAIIRNGEYNETIVTMQAHRAIANLALEIDAAYWRDITVNTMLPSPEAEKLHDGVMRFEFGPLGAGSTASFKVDAQVNPHRFGSSRGDFVLKDGSREIARVSRSLIVWP
jgi:hypothetical protein